MSLSREETAAGYPYAEEETEEPTEGEEPAADDPLAEFDEAQQEKIRALIAEREQETRSTMRQSLQARGLDVTEDGALAVRDGSKLGWLAPLPAGAISHQPSAVSAGPTADSGRLTAAPEEEEPAEIPDPVMQAEAFRKWHQRELQKAMAPWAQALEQERAERVETAIDIAMAKVPAAIEHFAPRFADLLNHPEFDGRMRQALATVAPSQWKDPQNLARVVGMLAVDFDAGRPAAPAQPSRPRDEAGRFASEREVGRSAISRATLAQMAPSREAGRQTKGVEPSDIDRAIAARIEEYTGRPASAEEVALLRADTTGDAAAVLRKQRLAKIRGGRT